MTLLRIILQRCSKISPSGISHARLISSCRNSTVATALSRSHWMEQRTTILQFSRNLARAAVLNPQPWRGTRNIRLTGLVRPSIGQTYGQTWEAIEDWRPRNYSRSAEDSEQDAHGKSGTTGPAAAYQQNGVLSPPKPLESFKDKQAYQRELYTVTVAICANMVIFVAKLVTYLYSGSSSMLAEAVHSVVDTFNQVLLRVGIVRSRKAPTSRHPYGYLKDKFVWSLVSAVGIFCLGAGITTAHGFSSLMAGPQALENLGYGLTGDLSAAENVLGVSFVVEGYSLLVATRAVLQGAEAAGLSFVQFLRRGLDPTSIAVMLEDGAAVTGLLIAGISTGVSHITANSMYDAVGSICIGLLLGCTALFLISQNRSLLIGRSMHPADMQRVMEFLRKDSIVKAIHDAKSEEIGPGIYRFKAELEFEGDKLVQQHLDRLGGVERLQEQIYSAVMTERKESLSIALVAYGNDMIGALGAEIDRLEAEIRQLVPGIRHIDLETDRGKQERIPVLSFSPQRKSKPTNQKPRNRME